jgi:DNA (cytosine-5)-methyltransferase 1
LRYFGDITKLRGAELPTVDVVTGGSPCQGVSLAGKREGLRDERSGLFREQIRILKEMREESKRNGKSRDEITPRYMVWENVPGAFSTNKGHDFQTVLTEIVRIAEPNAPDVPLPEKGKWPHAGELHDEMGKWSIAYKIVDAQYWGTPQRRRRISLVFDGGGVQASEVLFKQYSGTMPESEVQSVAESVSGYFEQSDKKREETARAVGDGTSGAISFQERAGKPGGGTRGGIMQWQNIKEITVTACTEHQLIKVGQK